MLDLSCFLAGLINFFVPLFLLLFFKKKFDSGVFPALAAFIACFPAFITGALIRSLFMTDDLLTFYIMQGILFGILEEGTKYMMLRFFLTSYDRKENTLSYGIGHSAYEGFGSAISCLGLIGSGKAASDILSFQIMTVIDRTVFTISLTVLIFYGIKNGKSKVITSPAYGDSRTTVAYGEYSRLSLQWINLFNLTEKEIMGVDKSLMGGNKYRNGFEFTLNSETLRIALSKIKDSDIERAGDVYSFYEDLNSSLKNIALKTKSGGYQFWVVGNRTVKNVLLQTDVIINELAPQYGLIPIYTVDRNIPNKVMPSRNSPTNETGITNTTMTMEHIVILRKK